MHQRELKCRVWDGQKMHYPDGPHSYVLDLNGDVLWGEERDPSATALPYTGLKDSEGKEMYEGDIKDCGENSIGVVEYSPEQGAYWLKGGRHPKTRKPIVFPVTTYGRVIGNIYEHPHLLT